jgi:hypothetical protein
MPTSCGSSKRAPTSNVRVDCLVWTDGIAITGIERFIHRQGGAVRHRVDVVRGLTEALPLKPLGAVASSQLLLQVEADYGYTIL